MGLDRYLTFVGQKISQSCEPLRLSGRHPSFSLRERESPRPLELFSHAIRAGESDRHDKTPNSWRTFCQNCGFQELGFFWFLWTGTGVTSLDRATTLPKFSGLRCSSQNLKGNQWKILITSFAIKSPTHFVAIMLYQFCAFTHWLPKTKKVPKVNAQSIT